MKEADTMVTIGVDAHKRTHTFVAVDDVGKKLAERTLPATSEGISTPSSG
jgi:transposase